MGKSGNTKGVKVYSINTTIRSPLRNIRFLEAYQEFNGMRFDAIWKKYYKKIISLGIYQPKIMDDSIKTKIADGVELSNEEVENLILINKGKQTERGRLGTQLSALRDQGFLKFMPKSGRSFKYVYITGLGFDLLDKNLDMNDVYCKAMIGLHAQNPARESMWNKSRPFLNTLHVINRVTKIWKEEDGRKEEGITDYEFGAFVLTMNDCNYKKTANDIIKFRRQKKTFKLTKKDFEDLLKKVSTEYKATNVSLANSKEIENGIKLIKREYPDDVFRKFQMTGLLDERKNDGGIVFYQFNEYNISKVNAILECPKYKFPKFLTFKSVDEYYEYLETKVLLPWEQSEETRIKMAKEKAEYLEVDGEDIFTEDGYLTNIKAIEEKLDDIVSERAFTKAIASTQEEKLLDELQILSGTIKDKKSEYDDIDEPLRLEYILALVFGLKYGKENVISNIKYNGQGTPLCHAPGGKPDIIFRNGKIGFIMEPTMLSNQTEMMKRESVGVWEHYGEQKREISYLNYGLLISPRVFTRIVCFFKFYANDDETNVMPISIDCLVNALRSSETIEDFNGWLDKSLDGLVNLHPSDYATKINNNLI